MQALDTLNYYLLVPPPTPQLLLRQLLPSLSLLLRLLLSHWLQAVGDLKEFTYYPKDLKPKHERLRASHTYMKESEKMLPAFLRPQRWFTRKDWKKTRRFRVLSLTNSEGDVFVVGVPEWSSPAFVRLVREKVGPWLQTSLPERSQFKILIDGEKVMHTAEVQSYIIQSDDSFLHRRFPTTSVNNITLPPSK